MLRRAFFCALVLAGCKDVIVPLSNGDDAGAPDDDAGVSAAEQAMTDWSDTAKGAARALSQTYGEPDATTSDALSWTSRGPWKRMVVHREEVKHAFPTPHSDVVEQVLDLKVPVDKIALVAQFDGSLVVARTSGEVTVWGPDERSNFGLINLTMDLVTGAKTPDQARQAYADATAQAAGGQRPAIFEKLQFPAPSGDQGDPDTAVTPPQ
jgi:hypothetical protein